MSTAAKISSRLRRQMMRKMQSEDVSLEVIHPDTPVDCMAVAGPAGESEADQAASTPSQKKKLFALAEVHLDHANNEVRNLATALLVHCERLFTFIEVNGVEPTNNTAERALRTAVQWRKISFGNRSHKGEIATARLLTGTQTCKRQRRHVLGYLTEAVRRHRRHTAAPSLLPWRI